ncbi:MAG TPA: anti-sigma factor, partial [Acidimicrobiales bacterium]|nr:anti-sigma factor [Acidimicrobiales bacterium]
DDRIDELEVALTDQALLRAASLALANPGAAEGVLRSPDGAVTATAVVLPDGTGYLMLDDVPDVGPARTYQLWGQSGDELISLGLLGPRPDDVVPFHASGDVAALAITEEDAPGVVRSENPPALAGRLT